MSEFLSTYHHFEPTRQGAHAVGLFWGLMSIGCLLGLVLLKLLDAKVVPGRVHAARRSYPWGWPCLDPHETSLVAFPMSGFFLSVMYSIVSLGLIR